MTTSGKKNNGILFYGEDTVLINEKCKEYIHHYFGSKGPEPIVFDEEGSYEEYIHNIQGQSLFAMDVVVIMHNPFFLNKGLRNEEEFSQFLTVLKNIPPEVLVIMTHVGKVDKRLSHIKELLKIVESREFNFLKVKEAPDELISMIRIRGKKLEYSVRPLLEEVIGAWTEVSLTLLHSICDKIMIMSAGQETVTAAVVREALPTYMEQGVFKFYDKLIAADSIYILQNTEHVFTDIPSILKNLGFISSKFRQMKMIKEMKRQHMSVKDMQNKLSVKYSFMWKNLERDADKTKETTIEWFLCEIFNFQYRMRVKAEKLEIIDLFLRFCQKQKYNHY